MFKGNRNLHMLCKDKKYPVCLGYTTEELKALVMTENFSVSLVQCINKNSGIAAECQSSPSRVQWLCQAIKIKSVGTKVFINPKFSFPPLSECLKVSGVGAMLGWPVFFSCSTSMTLLNSIP